MVIARDSDLIQTKMREIEGLGLPFIIVCGENFADPRVISRTPVGKWDAINCGYTCIPRDANLVVLNDIDTEIHGLSRMFSSVYEGADLVYAAVRPSGGPQQKFYAIANPLNKALNIFAMGELIVIRKKLLDRLMPIPPCLAEDTYLLFKAMELNYKVEFCDDAFVNTIRTTSQTEEVLYKERTTLGILQALDYTKPPPWIRLFYRSLPLLAMMLMLAGGNGRAWARGINRAVRLHVKGSNRTSF
jgi:hypothetical protein